MSDLILTTELISENTGVTLGIIIAAVVVFGGAVYWAGALQTKLDMLLTLVAANKISHEELEKRVSALEKDVAVLKQPKKE